MDSHQVIDFMQARTVLAQSLPSQDNDHGAWLRQIRQTSAELQRSLAVSQIRLLLLSDRLESSREDMAETEAFCRACQESCELADLPAMERERDRLTAELRDRTGSAAPDRSAPAFQMRNSPLPIAPAVPA